MKERELPRAKVLSCLRCLFHRLRRSLPARPQPPLLQRQRAASHVRWPTRTAQSGGKARTASCGNSVRCSNIASFEHHRCGDEAWPGTPSVFPALRRAPLHTALWTAARLAQPPPWQLARPPSSPAWCSGQCQSDVSQDDITRDTVWCRFSKPLTIYPLSCYATTRIARRPSP